MLAAQSTYPVIAREHTVIADQLYNEHKYFDAYLEYRSALEGMMVSGGSGYLLAFLVLFKLLMIRQTKLSEQDGERVDSVDQLIQRFSVLLGGTVVLA